MAPWAAAIDDSPPPTGYPAGHAAGRARRRWARLRDWPLRWKLMALMAGSSFFSLALAGTAVIVSDLVWYQRAVVNSITSHADLLAELSGVALVAGQREAAGAYLATFKSRPNTRCAAIYALDGTLFAAYRRPGEAQCQMPGPEAAGWRLDDRHDLLVFRPIEHGGHAVGALALRHAVRSADRVFSATGIVLAVLAGSLLMGVLLSARFQRVITQPVFDIVRVVRGVTEQRDYSLRVARAGADEVGLLTDAVNQLLRHIERTSGELQALNATLEQRVALRTHELEQANRELESFSYSVSHDLRAPLRAIDGFSALLQKGQADRLDEPGRDHLQRIRAAARRMAALIDDLLNLARTSRAELHRRDLDLSAMAQRVARDLAAAQPERALQFDIAAGLSAHADPHLLHTVLDNLLGNAVKFSVGTPAARITLAARRQDDGSTVYEVRDQGVGFDMAHAGHLFGAFQRLHPAGEFEGSGIGLANVQRIIHRHGGRIWAESQPGQGASFFFTLPG